MARGLGAFVAAALIVCGVFYWPAHRVYFDGSAFVQLFERLPLTLELVTASVIIALALAAATILLSRLPKAALGLALGALLCGLTCVPLFWIALFGEAAFAHTGAFGGRGSFSIAERFLRLALPATLMALVQAGAYVDSMRGEISVKRLFSRFALLLPAIVSADVIVETFFAWPGAGHLFFFDFAQQHMSNMAAFLLLSAAATIAVRAVGGGGLAEVAEPL